MEIAQPHKNGDLHAALSVIRSEFSSVEDFERAFPSLCFALATGVGKTRLMGAFIAYLHLEHGIRHFFVLAPNLTIYNKLVADFTPNTPKYVFQGIAEFAVKAPALVTGENFEQRPQVLDLFERDDVVINIFNISKFNARAADSRKIRRLSEFLGQSYFDYLAGLDDLVLIMDEAHRYRADSSMKSIEELKPVLGLELTATPQIEAGARPVRFKNVIFDYPLARAMQDGFVKEPAVATRANFNAGTMSPTALERLKLEDGIRIHESAKVELDVYAQQNDVRRVKPFMLVIASDTTHAAEIVKTIEDENFFDGRYKGRVIQVHSGQRGAEKDENVERLLSVEHSEESTEIVVHVNMLKEGWDVTNLYTIVPLRTADSRTLVEQSIGRGLRLPYGRRTGVAAVDRLTIVAHDRFQDIVDEAKKGGYSFSTVTIGEDFSETPRQTVVVAPRVEAILGISGLSVAGQPPITTSPNLGTSAPAPKFTSPEQIAASRLTMEAIQKVARDPKLIPGPKALETEEVQELLVATVADRAATGQLTTTLISPAMLAQVVRETTAVYVAQTIAIPRVIVLPQGTVRAGYHPFSLDLSSFRLQPVSQEILVQSLASDAREVIGALEGGKDEARLEDYVVRGLIDFDDVSYDEQAELLYGLAGQVVTHLRSYLKDEGEVRNVLLFHQRQIATLVHTQMQAHAWEEASSYEAVVSQGFSDVRPQAFAADAGEAVRPFDVPLAAKSDIRKMLFGGFKKCLYANQKFDSDPERRFAVVLEKDPAVLKWFKPGKGVFQIRYTADNDYEPDFVVETETEKLLCEPKRADQVQDPVVLAKAKAAATWCRHASAHETANGGKPWRYVLIPHDAIADNMTVAGLAGRFTANLDPEGDSRA
jgi:type III restriction enzyme